MDIEKFKQEGFSFEEIQDIQQWDKDIEEGKVLSEEEFFSGLESKIFAKKITHV